MTLPAWPPAKSAGTAALAVVGVVMLTSLVIVQRVARLGRRKKSLCGETLIGEIGEAQTGLGPDGVVTIRRRSYPASAATSIAAGERVRVIGTGKILAVERYTR